MADMVYFESNNVAMFNISSSSVVGDSTAGKFDSSVVDSAILIPAATSATQFYAGMPLANGGPSVVTKVYGHFDFFGGNGSTPTGALWPFLQIVSSTGQVVFRVDGSGSATTYQCSYWNGTTFTPVGPAFSMTFVGLSTYDFDFTPGAGGSFNLRVNNGSLPVVSCSSFNVAVTNVAEARVTNPCTATSWVSQGVLANFDLRGGKLAVTRITGNGFYTDGTGTYTDINTVAQNQLTGIGFTAAAQRKTFTKGNISTSGMVIHNVSVNALCAVSGGIVTGARAITRRAASDFSAANYTTLARGLEQRMNPLYVDPSTALAWTVANFNNTELGVQAQ